MSSLERHLTAMHENVAEKTAAALHIHNSCIYMNGSFEFANPLALLPRP
jgi:hypothetical protein